MRLLCQRLQRPLRVALCRDARSVRPLCQKLQLHGFNGDGRTDRASLQPLLVSRGNQKYLGSKRKSSTEKTKNSSELQFASSEVSFHSSELLFRPSVGKFRFLPDDS